MSELENDKILRLKACRRASETSTAAECPQHRQMVCLGPVNKPELSSALHSLFDLVEYK